MIAGDGVRDLHGLERLHAVGSLVITDDPRLMRLQGLEGVASVQSVLTNLDGLHQARIASGVTVRDNTLLPDSEAAALATLQNVTAR